MNLGVLEEWIEISNLPRGVISHLAPVRDLLNWLQVRPFSPSQMAAPFQLTYFSVPVVNNGIRQSRRDYPNNEASKPTPGSRKHTFWVVR